MAMFVFCFAHVRLSGFVATQILVRQGVTQVLVRQGVTLVLVRKGLLDIKYVYVKVFWIQVLVCRGLSCTLFAL